MMTIKKNKNKNKTSKVKIKKLSQSAGFSRIINNVIRNCKWNHIQGSASSPHASTPEETLFKDLLFWIFAKRHSSEQ